MGAALAVIGVRSAVPDPFANHFDPSGGESETMPLFTFVIGVTIAAVFSATS